MNGSEYLNYLQRSLCEPQQLEQSYLHSEMLRVTEARIGEVCNISDLINGNGTTTISSMMDSMGKNVIDFKSSSLNRLIVNQLLKSIPKQQRNKISRVPVGVLPTRDPNAATLIAPNGDPIIVFDIGIPMLLSYYNEVLMIIHANPHLSCGPALNDCYKYIAGYFSRAGQVAIEIPSDLPKLDLPKVLISMVVTMYQEMFILAHEFAHIYLGNTRNSGNFPRKAPEGIQTLKRSHEQEYMADQLAIEWMLLHINDKKHNEHTSIFKHAQSPIALIMNVFYLFNLVEINSLGGIENSHPKAKDRVTRLLANNERSLSYPVKKTIIQMLESFDEAPVFGE